LLGITGCIAAYKACELVRLLKKAGQRVKVVMTPAACEFVTPTTLRTLSEEPVALDPVDDPAAPIHHISLAQEADVLVIAPATANTLNKLAAGVADNLLTTTALACAAPLIVAPAMNTHMWRDEATQTALAVLRQRGAVLIEPETGELACGDVGEGRLAAVEQIAEAVLAELRRSRDLVGRRILVTAGPTREYIDPVRFISNPSSGITGFAVAEEAARRGAEVILVSGPVTLPDPFGCTVIRVESAEQMLAAAELHFHGLDAAVFTAAVADFRPAERATQKLKKTAGTPVLELVRNPDILTTLAGRPAGTSGANGAGAADAADAAGASGATSATSASAVGQRPYIVGFAAETEDVELHAREKLAAKGAHLIVANDVSAPGLGFASNQNSWLFVSAEASEPTGVQPKRTLANLLLDRIVQSLC
jgi:phosphopantothenoylcysteine decarboxylase/phosphopantothenate--cysteine ligase